MKQIVKTLEEINSIVEQVNQMNDELRAAKDVDGLKKIWEMADMISKMKEKAESLQKRIGDYETIVSGVIIDSTLS